MPDKIRTRNPRILTCPVCKGKLESHLLIRHLIVEHQMEVEDSAVLAKESFDTEEKENWWEEKKSSSEEPPQHEAKAEQIYVTQMPPSKTQVGISGMAIAALFLSIVSLCCFGPLGIASLILGLTKLNEISNQPNHPDAGPAKTSVVLSSLALIFYALGGIFEIL